jgi:hypothetical protein
MFAVTPHMAECRRTPSEKCFGNVLLCEAIASVFLPFELVLFARVSRTALEAARSLLYASIKVRARACSLSRTVNKVCTDHRA